MRYVLGPSFNSTRKAPASPAVVATAPQAVGVPAKSDPQVTLAGIDADAWKASLTIERYDLASANRLSEVRIYLLPAGGAIPADAAAWIASANPVTTGQVGTLQGGGTVKLGLPDVPPADYLGQVVLGYES